jgi:hypothetical protein
MAGSLKRIWQQDIHAHHVDRQTGTDAVLAYVAGGFPDPLMIGQQGCGALFGKRLQWLRMGG